MKSICIFCGSQPGQNSIYMNAATELGELLASKDIRVVYGGASIGLMGAVADSALKNNGKVIGVIPQQLVDREVAHKFLTELRVVKTMHQRKALMEELSTAFIALPGGFGTLDELCEIVTWGQLELHNKPIGLLNINNYYDGFITFLDHATEQGFIHSRVRQLVKVSSSPKALLELLQH